MGVIQSTAVNEKSLILGGAKIEASFDDGLTFENLGLTESASFSFDRTPLDQTPSNGVKYQVLRGIAGESSTASFTLFEIDLNMVNKLSGDLGTYDAETGTLSFGGGVSQSEVSLKFTNKTEYKADTAVATELSIDEGASYYVQTVVTLFKGVQTSGWGLDFKDKDATDPAITPSYEFLFENDIDKAVKAQMGSIVKTNVLLTA